MPDGWGMLLQDRIFRQKGILPNQLTTTDRLAFVGDKSMGALSFSPVSEFSAATHADIDLAILGLAAQTLFDASMSDYIDDNHDELDRHTQQVLAALVAGGSSGGARPKAQIYMPTGETQHCRTFAQPGDEAWLIKFTSKNLALGHAEGLCEAVYLQMAGQAKCQPPIWQLIEAPHTIGACAWLALKRFDYVAEHTDLVSQRSSGRLHMHSACGLLDADFRTPSLDYIDLIKTSRQPCKSPAAGQLQFRRAIFNLLSSNQDDHSKNWAFLQADDGQCQPSPFYDVTYSPHPFNEHATAFGGYGKAPPIKVIQKLAASAGYGS
ncbi:type II toxin-antitoxin system HipA family toxin [Methylophaga nitratireducenticrescens]